MHGLAPHLSRDEATGTARVVGIVLNNLSREDGRFNFADVEIILQPFVLGMQTDFLTTGLDEFTNFVNLHRLARASW